MLPLGWLEACAEGRDGREWEDWVSCLRLCAVTTCLNDYAAMEPQAIFELIGQLHELLSLKFPAAES